MRLLRRMILCSLALALAWLLGLLGFVSLIPSPAADDAPATDAIVVLTGGGGRIERGITLLAEGKAPLLFISGMENRAEPSRLLQQFLPGRPADPALAERIFTGTEARNTIGNVAETARFIHAHHVRSFRLVTSAYHMPRALAEFHYGLPHARIVPVPVMPEDFLLARWWRPGTLENQRVLSEYHKWLGAYARHALIGLRRM
ncbi:MAG: YdcF family protein [Alphaproteobacteria bacterium]|nr:YdcF family protein [Alphaproteobacteria bacterium]